ncbi:hypothetical protein [Burkholderia cepacia]|uniref:hypothetical protein n=1 Tax=Burkholderia cepacia TaxID=292 RepID=UPI00158CA7AC|nr:hypothetical protein [Burkholderia cepacia]
MIGSNSWASGESLSGGIALAVVPAALVSAAFVMGNHTGRATRPKPVSALMRPLLRAARWLVFLDTQYGWRGARRKSAGIEDAVGHVEAL